MPTRRSHPKATRSLPFGLLASALVLILGGAVAGPKLVAAFGAPAASAGTITVFKSPTCGCCSKWVDHLKENGFTVKVVSMDNVDPIKRKFGVSDDLASCHTGVIDGYALEGHVPADLIKRLLAEKPAVAGLAVPGMPMGSPGMEQGGGNDRYEVLTFTRTGHTAVYAKR